MIQRIKKTGEIVDIKWVKNKYKEVNKGTHARTSASNEFDINYMLKLDDWRQICLEFAKLCKLKESWDDPYESNLSIMATKIAVKIIKQLEESSNYEKNKI